MTSKNPSEIHPVGGLQSKPKLVTSYGNWFSYTKKDPGGGRHYTREEFLTRAETEIVKWLHITKAKIKDIQQELDTFQSVIEDHQFDTLVTQFNDSETHYPFLTFHGTGHPDNLASILQHGYLLPGDYHPVTQQVMGTPNGNYFGDGIYSTLDTSLAKWYSTFDSEQHIQLIVNVVFPGNVAKMPLPKKETVYGKFGGSLDLYEDIEPQFLDWDTLSYPDNIQTVLCPNNICLVSNPQRIVPIAVITLKRVMSIGESMSDTKKVAIPEKWSFTIQPGIPPLPSLSHFQTLSNNQQQRLLDDHDEDVWWAQKHSQSITFQGQIEPEMIHERQSMYHLFADYYFLDLSHYFQSFRPQKSVIIFIPMVDHTSSLQYCGILKKLVSMRHKEIDTIRLVLYGHAKDDPKTPFHQQFSLDNYLENRTLAKAPNHKCPDHQFLYDAMETHLNPSYGLVYLFVDKPVGSLLNEIKDRTIDEAEEQKILANIQQMKETDTFDEPTQKYLNNRQKITNIQKRIRQKTTQWRNQDTFWSVIVNQPPDEVAHRRDRHVSLTPVRNPMSSLYLPPKENMICLTRQLTNDQIDAGILRFKTEFNFQGKPSQSTYHRTYMLVPTNKCQTQSLQTGLEGLVTDLIADKNVIPKVEMYATSGAIKDRHQIVKNKFEVGDFFFHRKHNTYSDPKSDTKSAPKDSANTKQKKQSEAENILPTMDIIFDRISQEEDNDKYINTIYLFVSAPHDSKSQIETFIQKWQLLMGVKNIIIKLICLSGSVKKLLTLKSHFHTMDNSEKFQHVIDIKSLTPEASQMANIFDCLLQEHTQIRLKQITIQTPRPHGSYGQGFLMDLAKQPRWDINTSHSVIYKSYGRPIPDHLRVDGRLCAIDVIVPKRTMDKYNHFTNDIDPDALLAHLQNVNIFEVGATLLSLMNRVKTYLIGDKSRYKRIQPMVTHMCAKLFDFLEKKEASLWREEKTYLERLHQQKEKTQFGQKSREEKRQYRQLLAEIEAEIEADKEGNSLKEDWQKELESQIKKETEQMLQRRFQIKMIRTIFHQVQSVLSELRTFVQIQFSGIWFDRFRNMKFARGVMRRASISTITQEPMEVLLPSRLIGYGIRVIRTEAAKVEPWNLMVSYLSTDVFPISLIFEDNEMGRRRKDEHGKDINAIVPKPYNYVKELMTRDEYKFQVAYLFSLCPYLHISTQERALITISLVSALEGVLRLVKQNPETTLVTLDPKFDQIAELIHMVRSLQLEDPYDIVHQLIHTKDYAKFMTEKYDVESICFLLGLLLNPRAKPIFTGEGVNPFGEVAFTIMAEAISRSARSWMRSEKKSSIEMIAKLFKLRKFGDSPNNISAFNQSGKFYIRKLSNCSPFAVVATLEFLVLYHRGVPIENIMRSFQSKEISMKNFLSKYLPESNRYAAQIGLLVQGLLYPNAQKRQDFHFQEPGIFMDEGIKQVQAHLSAQYNKQSNRQWQLNERYRYRLDKAMPFTEYHKGMPKLFTAKEVAAENIKRSAKDQLVLLPTGLLRDHCCYPGCPEFLVNQSRIKDRQANRKGIFTRTGLRKHLSQDQDPLHHYLPGFHQVATQLAKSGRNYHEYSHAVREYFTRDKGPISQKNLRWAAKFKYWEDALRDVWQQLHPDTSGSSSNVSETSNPTTLKLD